MTAQCRERLIYNGEEYYLATEPLASYLIKYDIRFIAPHTACWRGYIGSWLIEDNKLYLVDLKANISENNKKYGADKEVGLDFLFPGQTKVFANWYSEVIHIPHGKMMKYVHQGYASLHCCPVKGRLISLYPFINRTYRGFCFFFDLKL